MTRRTLRWSRRGVLMSGMATTLSALATGPGVASAKQPMLRKGGYAIYFRHAATTWSGVDRIEWPRSRQRLLSAEGIRQSQQIGQAFVAQGIPVGEVIASPFARCRDMAEIAFGRVEERAELLGLLSDTEGHAARIAFLRTKLQTPPAPGMNRIIVSHRSNIAEVAGVALAEGEGVIVRPSGSGFEVLETRMPGDWAGA